MSNQQNDIYYEQQRELLDDETMEDKLKADAYVESLETPDRKHFYSPVLEVIKLMK